MAAITLRELTGVFLRAGNLTFGGGSPTVAVLYQELVERRRAITEGEYGIAFALARVTPGTNVLAFSAATGFMMARWAGSISAVVSASLPGAFMVLGLTRIAESGEQFPLLGAAIQAMIASVIGLIGATVVQLAKPSWKSGRRVFAVLLIGISATIAHLGYAPPIVIIGMAAVLGAFYQK